MSFAIERERKTLSTGTDTCHGRRLAAVVVDSGRHDTGDATEHEQSTEATIAQCAQQAAFIGSKG